MRPQSNATCFICNFYLQQQAVNQNDVMFHVISLHKYELADDPTDHFQCIPNLSGKIKQVKLCKITFYMKD
ncbi:protein of unknown function [Xenorhabdus nematophila AN6/1]|nr:protein of unknown function [Xenorhabdus nematophila AN6/1]